MGLAKRYRSLLTEQHNPLKKGRNLTGTPRYASINAHCGLEQSRRDDLESLGYMLIYFALGRLPWQGCTEGNTKDERNKKIAELKMSIPMEVLCQDCPKEFLEFLMCVRSLKYEEEPDYNHLRNIFQAMLLNMHEINDFNFDWCPKTPESAHQLHVSSQNQVFFFLSFFFFFCYTKKKK